jgi:hypothetical protein
MDDPRRRPLRQLRLCHIEVVEGLPVAELRHHGRVQEPRLPGQDIEEATHPAIERSTLVRVQAEPTPTTLSTSLLHQGGAKHEPTIFSVVAPQSGVDLLANAGLLDLAPALQER